MEISKKSGPFSAWCGGSTVLRNGLCSFVQIPCLQANLQGSAATQTSAGQPKLAPRPVHMGVLRLRGRKRSTESERKSRVSAVGSKETRDLVSLRSAFDLQISISNEDNPRQVEIRAILLPAPYFGIYISKVGMVPVRLWRTEDNGIHTTSQCPWSGDRVPRH